MRWGSDGRSGRLVPVALGLGVLALVGVVAVAADDLPLRGPRDPGASRWHLPGLGDAVTGVFAVVAVVGVVLLLVLGRGGPRTTTTPRRSFSSQLVAFLLLLLVLWAFGHRTPPDTAERPRRTAARPAATSAAPRPETAAADRPSGPSRSLAPALGLVALAIASVAVAVAVARGRRRDELPEEDGARRAAAGAVGEALDGLLDDPDPRTAILAAYGVLLAGLERAGLPRRASEAPDEYLGRVLGGLSVRPEPLVSLTALFAEARFSEHPLAETHRTAALEALRGARDDLARAGTAAAAASPRPAEEGRP